MSKETNIDKSVVRAEGRVASEKNAKLIVGGASLSAGSGLLQFVEKTLP